MHTLFYFYHGKENKLMHKTHIQTFALILTQSQMTRFVCHYTDHCLFTPYFSHLQHVLLHTIIWYISPPYLFPMLSHLFDSHKKLMFVNLLLFFCHDFLTSGILDLLLYIMLCLFHANFVLRRNKT